MFQLYKFFVLSLCLLLISFVIAQPGDMGTKEGIIESRRKRVNQLESVLDNAQRKLRDHYSGKKVLDEKKVKLFQQKVEAYEHQIGELSREIDDKEIQEMIDRYNELRASRNHEEL